MTVAVVFAFIVVGLGLAGIMTFIKLRDEMDRLEDKGWEYRQDVDAMKRELHWTQQRVNELRRNATIPVAGECPKCERPMLNQDSGDYLCRLCRYGE